jgi:quercetin dioxygenase-like cupin family protein
VIDQEQRFLAAGDVVFIPRDTVHYFTNASPYPAIALVVFTPPFDGKDTVPVNTP